MCSPSHPVLQTGYKKEYCLNCNRDVGLRDRPQLCSVIMPCDYLPVWPWLDISPSKGRTALRCSNRVCIHQICICCHLCSSSCICIDIKKKQVAFECCHSDIIKSPILCLKWQQEPVTAPDWVGMWPNAITDLRLKIMKSETINRFQATVTPDFMDRVIRIAHLVPVFPLANGGGNVSHLRTELLKCCWWH